MGTIVVHNQPCPSCGSSDARQVYEDGSSHCFSCTKNFRAGALENTTSEKKVPSFKKTRVSLEEIATFQSRGFKERDIQKVVCEFFGVKVSYGSDGVIDGHYYPYAFDGKVGYKHRVVATKDFEWIGETGSLFGRELFAGGGKRLVITEGEIDALSVAQASMDKYNKIYPVVSLTSATGVNKLLEHREWIRSFQEVVLWFDNDEAGESALQKALKIVGIDKAKIAKFEPDCKDANDVLVKKGMMALHTCIWDAQPWVPAGIIRKEQLWEALCQYNAVESIPYPDCMTGVNEKVKGMRLGEIVLFISGTGSGKSTLLREIMLHLIKNTEQVEKDAKLGVVSLEEAPAETARKLSGMAIKKNPANEEIPLEELKVGFDEVFGDDRIILLDHQGSISDGSIVDQLEYMALMGCKYLFIDHITILVSEGADGLTGNEAIDKVMNDLLRLVKRHNVWIGLVSHLRKAPTGKQSFELGNLPTLDDIRGSGSIKQVSFDVVAFARNMQAEDVTERNSIKMAVLKSRYTGLTGIVTGAFYDHQTGRLFYQPDAPVEDFTIIS